MEEDGSGLGETVEGSSAPFSARLFSARSPRFPLYKGAGRAPGEGAGPGCLCLLGASGEQLCLQERLTSS